MHDEHRDRVARIQAEWHRERPEVDVSPQGVIGRLHRLADRLHEEIAAVYAGHGLSEGEFDVLATLRRAGQPYERSAGELAAWTMITSGGLTKRLDRLERAALVTRRVSDGDGRGRVVRLTPEGLRLVDAAFSAHMANERRLLDLVPAQDHPVLEGILRDWLGRLDPEG